MKKNHWVCALGAIALCCAGFRLDAQSQRLAASAFFENVSDYYASMYDMEANVQITSQKTNMSGTLWYKRPGLLRVDFSSPRGQVLVYDGERLTIYIPGREAILSQSATGGGTGLATPLGLSLMSRYYTIAYETGQAPVPLSPGSDEMVVNLILTRKASSEEFRTIKLSINSASLLIRRIEAVTTQNDKFVMVFTNLRPNVGISRQKFDYDTKPTANVYDNFLFSE